MGCVTCPRVVLQKVVGGDDAQLVGVGARLRARGACGCLDVAHRGQEPVGLVEEGVLPVGDGLRREGTA